MAEDLGTWPPEQATVLVEVLQQAGITPQARRTREGIAVSVEDQDSDQAHATLVANMDTIARAARPPAGDSRRRRPRAVPGGPSTRREPSGATERPLGSERLARFGRPVAILLAGLLISAVVPHAGLRLLVMLVTVVAMIWLLGRDADEDEDGPGTR